MSGASVSTATFGLAPASSSIRYALAPLKGSDQRTYVLEEEAAEESSLLPNSSAPDRTPVEGFIVVDGIVYGVTIHGEGSALKTDSEAWRDTAKKSIEFLKKAGYLPVAKDESVNINFSTKTISKKGAAAGATFQPIVISAEVSEAIPVFYQQLHEVFKKYKNEESHEESPRSGVDSSSRRKNRERPSSLAKPVISAQSNSRAENGNAASSAPMPSNAIPLPAPSVAPHSPVPSDDRIQTLPLNLQLNESYFPPVAPGSASISVAASAASHV